MSEHEYPPPLEIEWRVDAEELSEWFDSFVPVEAYKLMVDQSLSEEELREKIEALIERDRAALAPCPFCNGRAIFDKNGYGDKHLIICSKCHSRSDDFDDKIEAQRSWNHRVDEMIAAKRGKASA